MKPIPYGRQTITDEDVAAVTKALRSDLLTQGPVIEEFERKFAAYVGAPYAVAVSNGTAALHLAAAALDTKPGTRVITTPVTFAASANCVRYCGGDVSFADVNPKTWLIDLAAVRALLEKHPKGTFRGVVSVDFAGLPVDLEALRALADEFGLWIISDASHSPGASFRGESGRTYKVGDGRLANLTVFSFHPVKHIACGEGGAITTADKKLFDRLRRLRTHGITKDPSEYVFPAAGPWYHEMQELGFNYRLTEMQAALGLSQLSRADSGLARRREIAARYDDAFRGTAVGTPEVPAGREHAWHLYVVQLKNRAEAFRHLHEKKIFAQVHYLPVHLHPYYRELGWKEGDFPASEAYYHRAISLPMYPALTNDEQDYVIRTIKEIAK